MAKKTSRFYLAMFLGKLARGTQKLLGMNATFFPGKLALQICPDFMGQIEKPKYLIGVTGTNGKTTVSNLLVDLLETQGIKTTNNRSGSNTKAGVAAALLINSTFSGKSKNEWGVIEIDERSSMHIYPYIKPGYVVCTNLFRDSILRNAHAEYISDIISANMQPETKMILNADDLISSGVAPENERVYYSIKRLPTDTETCENIINDCRICPKCAAKLEYEYVRYHQIGKAHCPNCGFASPVPDYEAEVHFDEQYMILNERGTDERYTLISDSIFNVYNQVTVTTLLREMGLTPDQIRDGFSKLHIVDTRYNKITVGGIDVIDHMAKEHNPVACSVVFDYLSKEPGTKEILFLLDDEKVFENMTWMYDCDYEKLNSPLVKHIVIPGNRAKDQKLRLMMAGVPEEKIIIGMTDGEAPGYLDFEGTDKVFVLHQCYKPMLSKKLDGMIVELIKKREEQKG